MADQKDELPEGTDKVVVGASNPAGTAGLGAEGAVSTASGASEAESALIDADFEPLEPTGTATASSQGRLSDRLRTGSEKLSAQAGDRARGLVTQGLERGSEALANVGRLVGDTATGLDERLGAEYGDYARRAAGAIENAANSIASKDPDELIEDTRNFVRNSPGVAIAGAAIVGFALARLVKSGLGGGDDDRGRGRSSES